MLGWLLPLSQFSYCRSFHFWHSAHKPFTIYIQKTTLKHLLNFIHHLEEAEPRECFSASSRILEWWSQSVVSWRRSMQARASGPSLFSGTKNQFLPPTEVWQWGSRQLVSWHGWSLLLKGSEPWGLWGIVTVTGVWLCLHLSIDGALGQYSADQFFYRSSSPSFPACFFILC